jgi:hypothetical protein
MDTQIFKCNQRKLSNTIKPHSLNPLGSEDLRYRGKSSYGKHKLLGPLNHIDISVGCSSRE